MQYANVPYAMKHNNPPHNDWIANQQESGAASYKWAAESYNTGELLVHGFVGRATSGRRRKDYQEQQYIIRDQG